jgi:hypothetical protein
LILSPGAGITGTTGPTFGDEGVVPSGVFGSLLWCSDVSLWSSEGVLSPPVSCFSFPSPVASSCGGTLWWVPSGAILQYLPVIQVNFDPFGTRGKHIRDQIIPIAGGFELIVIASAKDDVELFTRDKLLQIWVEPHPRKYRQRLGPARENQDGLFPRDRIEERTNSTIEEFQDIW